MKSLARKLRGSSTEAEAFLWQHLRARQLGGFKFRRQLELGPYIADFVCIEKKLIVEADGGQHGEQLDGVRTEYLESLGYRVLRFWNHEILAETEAVLEQILAELQTSPHPNPLPLKGVPRSLRAREQIEAASCNVNLRSDLRKWR